MKCELIMSHRHHTSTEKLCNLVGVQRSSYYEWLHRKKYRPCTTNSKHTLPVVSNVIQGDFTALSPNRKWGADITYIPTDEGWLYVSIVLDFYARKIVGMSTESTLHTKLCSDALKMAIIRRRPPTELVHHSDRACSMRVRSIKHC